MAEKRKFSPPVVGGSSLLVIFAVLCLVIFALLSLSTVSADMRLAEKSRTFVTEYYAADSKAEQVLAQLRAGETPEGVKTKETGEGTLCRYQCEISSQQSLAVEALVTEDSYEILRWQVISTAEFKTDNTIKVWDGQQEAEGD